MGERGVMIKFHGPRADWGCNGSKVCDPTDKVIYSERLSYLQLS